MCWCSESFAWLHDCVKHGGIVVKFTATCVVDERVTCAAGLHNPDRNWWRTLHSSLQRMIISADRLR